jgi:hypothetical protein
MNPYSRLEDQLEHILAQGVIENVMVAFQCPADVILEPVAFTP